MAHEITIRADGTAEMAFTGSRKAIWHGLGQQLDENASIETWKKQAGLDWEVFESSVIYQTIVDGKLVSKVFPNKKALFRSDTKDALSIVGNDFKIVQPGDVLEFFRDLVSGHGMRLSTAGSLFGGTRFWALAETGKADSVVKGDEIKGYLLLTTAVDGSLATTAKFVSTRVVCNNTLTVAMAEGSKNMVRKTHKTVWNASEVKIDLGLIDGAWNKFMENLRALSNLEMSDKEVREFYQSTFFNPNLTAEEQGWGATKRVNELMHLYANGAGASLSYGTAWGALNAVTEMFTHGSGKRDASHQFWDSYYGTYDAIKNKVMTKLLTMAE
jgi:phage/plasmid-like protein (TIGR03299 family)